MLGAGPEGQDAGSNLIGADSFGQDRDRQVCCVLQHVAVCCSVLQRVAVCCSVLQFVAVCCSVLQRGEIDWR